MTERVCAVAGVGPGNGTALSKKFAAEGYRVAMLARSEDRLRRLEEEIPSARGYPVDIGDRGQVRSTIERIGGELGPVEVLVHNAAAGAFNSFLDAEPATLEPAFAPTKAAQRILAQSMARSLGPRGIHVAYVVVDAVIDVPWTRQLNPDRPDEFFCQPSDIAESVFHVARQKRSAWTFEMDLRPFGEKW
jgi:NAD(P)-dependent dehydrogenase (short-subunit alcohol dehydrogenase family)